MSNDISEIPSTSPNFRTELARQLAELVPEAIADGKFDVAKLKELLGDDYGDDNERFGLFWPGKKRALRAAQEPTTATLKPMASESKDWDTTQNVYIEGDNLEVLKILQKHYHNKIKMIYIDPPYNTGNDFIYPDNYTEGLQSYLEFTRQVDEEGRRLRTNNETDGRYHSNWLSMIFPRLKLARNLLTDDGVLLVSINDVEQPNLRRLCDEVFGETNFLTQFVWLNDGNVDQQSKIKGVHEYVLAYARNLDQIQRPSVIDPNVDEQSKLFRENIENSITKNGPANPPSTVDLPVGFPAGFERGVIPPRDNKYPHILDEIVVENAQLVQPARVRSGWSSRNLLDLFISNECEPILDTEGRETWFELRNTGAIYGLKKRADDQGHVLSVLRNMGTTKQNSSQLASWGIQFSYPKPVRLIEYLVSIFTESHESAVVLDFFSGSGTTAHAVMQQNAKDGGSRRHIQIQLPEPTTKDSHGCKAGSTTIAEIGRRRIDFAGDKIKSDLGRRLTTRYTPLDIGYRTYKLIDTNLPKWKAKSEVDDFGLQQELLRLGQAGNGDSSSDDLLTELLLKQGYSLTEQITHLNVAGLTVLSLGDNLLLAYLDTHIKPTLQQLRALAEIGPAKLIVLDDVFQGDDELKTNLVQICKSKDIELGTV